MDLTTGWDFNRVEDRQMARAMVAEQQPRLLVGSPMCARYSQWQYTNDKKRSPELVKREKLQALVHMQFVATLYAYQHYVGRSFLHEHPDGATSWDLECMDCIAAKHGVYRVWCDQCQMGANDGKG